MTAITLNLEPLILLTDDTFYALCRANPEVKFELSAMPPLNLCLFVTPVLLLVLSWATWERKGDRLL